MNVNYIKSSHSTMTLDFKTNQTCTQQGQAQKFGNWTSSMD